MDKRVGDGKSEGVLKQMRVNTQLEDVLGFRLSGKLGIFRAKALAIVGSDDEVGKSHPSAIAKRCLGDEWRLAFNCRGCGGYPLCNGGTCIDLHSRAILRLKLSQNT